MNKIKFFGHADDSDLLLELSEVSVQGDPDQLRLLGEFILQCSEKIRKDPFWEHEHFIDFCKSKNDTGDFIVASLPKEKY